MAPVRAPTLKKPSPWHLFTHLLNKSTFSVSRIIDLKSFDIHYMSFINSFLPSKSNILGACHFFFLFSFTFIAHLFRGLAGACVNPEVFSHSLFVHSLVCLITHSFLNEFQPNLYQHFLRVCSTCHTIFSLKQHLNVFVKGYYTAG